MAYHPTVIFITENRKPGVKKFYGLFGYVVCNEKRCAGAQLKFHYYVVARGTDVA